MSSRRGIGGEREREREYVHVCLRESVCVREREGIGGRHVRMLRERGSERERQRERAREKEREIERESARERERESARVCV